MRHLDEYVLRINLLLTQGIVLAVAVVASLFIHSFAGTVALFAYPGAKPMAWAVAVALFFVSLSLWMDRALPKQWVDDGEINRRLFHGLSLARTALLCVLVGVSEEWLFRGVLQPMLGNGWTSLVFTLIHFRYLRKAVLAATVFATSFVLGFLFDASGNLLAPILAHSLIDFLLALSIQRRSRRETDG